MKRKHLIGLFLLVSSFTLVVCIIIVNYRMREPKHEEYYTDVNNVTVDIDFKDGGFVSVNSNVTIHEYDGNIVSIRVPVDILWAFDIPDRYGDRVYTLSEDDVNEIIEYLDQLKDDANNETIDAIIDILLDEWYAYTPT